MVSIFILALNLGAGSVAHHTSSTIAHPLWLSKQDTLLQGAKSIESRDYVEDIREGNRIVARRTLRLKYEVTWSLSDSGIRSNDVIEIYCWNECKGGKHKEHSECDFSCDERCSLKHNLNMRGRYEPLKDNMRQAERDARAAAVASGGSADRADWTGASTDALRQARRIAERARINKTINHWADKPCVFDMREWGWKRYDFTIVGSFTKFISETRSGVTTNITEPGESHTMTVAYVWLPDENHRERGRDVYCKCKYEPEEIQDLYDVEGPHPFFDTFVAYETEDGIYLNEPDKKSSINITGVDMNYAVIEYNTPFHGEYFARFPVGTTLIPTSGNFQEMLLIEPANIPSSNFIASIYDFPISNLKQVRILCLQMGKPEPNKNTKFRVRPTSDPGRRNMAKISANTRLRTGLEQARLWILTDQATIDVVNKRLFPPVSEGQYTNGLYDVARVGNVDILSREYAKCLNAELLIGSTASLQSTDWLIQNLIEQNARSFTDNLRKMFSKFTNQFEKTGDRFDIQHSANLASSLCESADENVRSVGMDFLLNAIPANKRTEVEQAGGLDGLLGLVMNGTEKEGVKALDVCAQYKGEKANSIIESAALWSNSQVVQKKAEGMISK